jgi:hypothetical protein
MTTNIDHTAEKNASYWLAKAADGREQLPRTVTALRDIRAYGKVVAPQGSKIYIITASNAGFRGIEIYGYQGDRTNRFSVSAGAVK